MPDPVLEVRNLVKHYPMRRDGFSAAAETVHAVDDVSFRVMPGETLGLVGESGCGKSTVGRSVLKLVEPTAGRILLDGQDISRLTRADMRPLRRKIQMVFQDPYSSLNPRMTAADIVGEPLEVFGVARGRRKKERVAALFERVGLRPDHMDNFPNQFSGGQRQRIGIARALALEPKVIVADEPVSALDVSIQAQVINLLNDLQREFGISYLFIAHDLAVVEYISHRVAVMYLGKIVECADKRSLFSAPHHPYTEVLLAAVPVPDPKVRRARRGPSGEIGSPIHPPSGCRFHPRCPLATDVCRREEPPLRRLAGEHWVACHHR